MAKKLTAAALAFIGGAVSGMMLLALVISVFDLDFQSVMPGALAVGVVCAIVSYRFPGLGERLLGYLWC